MNGRTKEFLTTRSPHEETYTSHQGAEHLMAGERNHGTDSRGDILPPVSVIGA